MNTFPGTVPHGYDFLWIRGTSVRNEVKNAVRSDAAFKLVNTVSQLKLQEETSIAELWDVPVKAESESLGLLRETCRYNHWKGEIVNVSSSVQYLYMSTITSFLSHILA